MIPKPARESRTLRLSNILMGLGSLLLILPDVASDPAIAPLIEALPHRYRAGVGAILALVGWYVRYLRMTTSAPIAEKWLATEDPEPPQPPDVPSFPANTFHRGRER